MKKNIIYLFSLLFFSSIIWAQQAPVRESYWHNKERQIHYKPAGYDFVCVNPTMRFNRALYGTNTGFRVEAGDLPEFAMYMPGMGGNFKFGILVNGKSKWLTTAQHIKATYRPGSMLYEITDTLLGSGVLRITILALANMEGMIIKTDGSAIANNVELLWVYGGASGKKFSRDGDIGADPESSFYLQPDYCKDNVYKITNNSFTLSYGTGKILTEEEQYEINNLNKQTKTDSVKAKPAKFIAGIIPPTSTIHIADAAQQATPQQLYATTISATPAITGVLPTANGVNYFLIQNAVTTSMYVDIPALFTLAEEARKVITNRIIVTTPDPYINTLGAALSTAADAIWEEPTYLHGAVAWRMRLPAWRGPYVADPLGWHDRAKKHFSSYALSQVIGPVIDNVIADTALHLARQLEKIGTALFSNGYICRNPGGDIRAHHYDMNLVYIDALLNHLNWTGNKIFAKEMWPLLQRHLAWEKRNFDADGDGLYDAYAAIWASDALQYSGGGVTHTSAYNYRANKMAAEIADLIDENGMPYKIEATHILAAIEKNLWMANKGWYAEYKDILGLQKIHPAAGLWTIYHAIDSKLPTLFQAYQCLQYINTEIPHIPIKAKGLLENDMFLLSTTNWQPYTWSLNNVVLAENQHTALAYWQAGQQQAAYQLWRSSLIESMYLSASPGGFQQLSFYDAVRGELYRDFADPIAMVARSLVEGLFGIQPNALHDTLTIYPGLPMQWSNASLTLPDIVLNFKRQKNADNYTIIPKFQKKMQLQFKVNAKTDAIKAILVNGKKTNWSQINDAIDLPIIVINAPAEKKYVITIIWQGKTFEKPLLHNAIKKNQIITLQYKNAKAINIYDPQQILSKAEIVKNSVSAIQQAHQGNKTFFVQVNQGQFTYWQGYSFTIEKDEKIFAKKENEHPVFEKIDIASYYNDKVTNIFKQQYLSPRVKTPTLQLPIQGIGNWCYPLIIPNINDAGLRQLAANKNEITIPQGIPFSTPSDTALNNIVFTSQWDNYPRQVTIPLRGKADKLHLLMAGSTNAMQSRFVNGEIIVQYVDLTNDTLELINPQNWWPIEQDYYNDGYAFTTNAAIPLRLYLQQGKFAYGVEKYTSIKGFSNRVIEGGAATVLPMLLNPLKELKSLIVHTTANDVVIGLMSVTLQRN